jgi:hypothetical protein
MNTTFTSQIEKTLKSDVEFEFSLDFQGQVEYIESEDTDQFLEYELVLLFLVDKGSVPINERTEGVVTIKDGIVEITYKLVPKLVRIGMRMYGTNTLPKFQYKIY